MSNAWRRAAAALADPQRRAVYAELVLGLPGTPGRARDRIVAGLVDAGLVTEDGAPTDLFGRLLAETPAERREGVDRWLRDGRIEQYPAGAADRDELLGWVASRLPDGEFGERVFTQQLAAVSDDPVALRRYLVDAGLVERAADGSRYRRV